LKEIKKTQQNFFLFRRRSSGHEAGGSPEGSSIRVLERRQRGLRARVRDRRRPRKSRNQVMKHMQVIVSNDECHLFAISL